MQKYKRKLLCLLKNKEMKNKERGRKAESDQVNCRAAAWL